MDLIKHYNSYRENVSKDALIGFPDFAKKLATKKPEKWPTTFDFLSHAVGILKDAASKGDIETYKLWLKSHQNTMILLFERMVEDHLANSDCIELDLLVMAKEKGWNWFKFAPQPLRFDIMVWVPRFTSKFTDAITKPIFCADELKLLLDQKPDEGLMKSVLERKRNASFVVTAVAGSAVSTHPTKGANGETIREWTQELFV